MIERKELSKEETVKLERKEISRQDVSRRAYELYVQRGRETGKDVEDWIRAEKELTSAVAAGPARTKAALVGHA